MEHITSRSNPLLSKVRKLIKDRSYRRETGEFVCDGVKMLEEAVKWQADVTAVILTEGLELDFPLPKRARCVTVPADVMASVSPMKAPQGALFLCRMNSLTAPERLEGRTWLVLDGLQDPGNVGTIWRTADAFGADALLLTGHSADPYNWKTVRASMGAVFRLKAWELEPDELTALCRRSGAALVGTALREDTVSLKELPAGPLRHGHRQRGSRYFSGNAGGMRPHCQDSYETHLRITERRCCRFRSPVGALAQRS